LIGGDARDKGREEREREMREERIVWKVERYERRVGTSE
jgi:hypothetical protein